MSQKAKTILRWIAVLPAAFLGCVVVNVVTGTTLYFLNVPAWGLDVMKCIYSPIAGLFIAALVAPNYKYRTVVTIGAILNILALGAFALIVFGQKNYEFADRSKIILLAVQLIIYFSVSLACCFEIGRREKAQKTPPEQVKTLPTKEQECNLH